MSRWYWMLVPAVICGLTVGTRTPPVYAEGHQSESAAQDDSEEAGSRLWSQNCGMCHNKRSPEKYSDAQWDVIVHHMRTRANLTGEEQRKIVAFLKSANG